MATHTEHSIHRRFDAPDEVRRFDHGRFEVIKIGDATVGRGFYEPGWRWTNDMRAQVGTKTCQTEHLAYIVSGRLHVREDDGYEFDLGPGEVAHVQPGHDAWVVGDEPVVYLEFRGAASIATRAGNRPASITLMPSDVSEVGPVPVAGQAAPAPTARPAEPTPTAARPTEALNRFVAVLNSRRPEGLDQVLARDVVDHDPFPGQEAGIEGFRESVRGMMSAFPDMKVTAEDVFEAGEKVAFVLTCAGTHQAELMGIPPTGNSVRVRNLGIFRVVDGLVKESWGTVDGLDLLAQLGAAPWQSPPRQSPVGDNDIL